MLTLIFVPFYAHSTLGSSLRSPAEGEGHEGFPPPPDKDLEIELFNFSFFSVTIWGIGLDHHDIEWFALEMNRDHSVVSEIASNV